MKKNSQLQQFLKNKPKAKNECNHDENHWCGNCLNFGQEVDFTKEGLGKGHIISNK